MHVFHPTAVPMRSLRDLPTITRLLARCDACTMPAAITHARRAACGLVTGFVFSVGLFGLPAEADEATRAEFEQDILPVLTNLCFPCHGPEKAEGGVRLDQLDPDLVNGLDAETWHDAFDQLNQGEMPPTKAKQPSPQERRRLTDWIRSALDEATQAKRFRNGRVITRRLTSYEYANTMRDLLGLELDYARNLPPDPVSADGFQNSGATLEMSPAQVEVYLQVARTALSEAIVDGEPPRQYEYAQQETATGKLPIKKVAGHEPVRPEFILDLKEFPRHGEFELKITAQAAIPQNDGLPRMRVSMGHVPGIIHVPRGKIGEVDVSENLETYTFRGRMEDFPQPGPVSFGNSGFKGMIVMIDFVDADGNELRYPDRQYAQRPQPKKKPGKEKKPSKEKKTSAAEEAASQEKPPPQPFGSRLDVRVTAVEFRSPIHASWPPPSHQRLLMDSDDSDDEPRYVREVLGRFMKRAFRRDVTQEEVEQAAELFGKVRPRSGSFEEAIRETFAAVLVSPHFLYIVEKREDPTAPQRVTDWELASRLSYFLWSSAPDQRLLDLARQDQLHQPDVLETQVVRMLTDPRCSEFRKRFVAQWLDLDALDRVAVNPNFFPTFRLELKQKMRQETEEYFTEILQQDRSALELLDSDWTMLNRALAMHYGLDGPRSSRFEKVILTPTKRRGGVLWHGSTLLANSNGEDSHPIKRAVWILDRLLGSPPASPPPDVPDLNEDSPDMAKLTLKEQLAAHRKKESCSNCHRRIDPWGIPLENFDAIGRWRTRIPEQNQRPETKVDALSVLPDGTEISGVRQLQEYLVNDCREDFARSLVRRLMAYSMGRSLDFGDREAIESLSSDLVENEFRLKPLIIKLVQSDTFQSK